MHTCSAGPATVDLTTGDVRFRHDTDDEALVPGLWERYVFRHRGVPLLFDRLKRMRDYGETLFEELEQPPVGPAPTPRSDTEATGRRAKTKIGRNEPCPCGSGRKYKKCCLLRLSS